ncbi:MAG TPA: beta-galactosidase [Pyrinomonadaceae bacterium]
MKPKRSVLLALVLILSACVPASAQSPLPSSPPSKFFREPDMMTIGVYYYPEAWDKAQWARDISNIKKLGMEFIHMGEFAWAFMEPKEGEFDLDWLAENVELATRQGLKVILCTPSAAPPVWLTKKHPEILMVDAAGRRQNHGARQHACWSAETYRKYVERVNTQLARRFGDNPNVIGWQIDNELTHYGKPYCYCEHCQAKFRKWLKAKYGDVKNLNRDWGNAFWSQMYQSFEQIDIPNAQQFVALPNPHAVLDHQRWFAEEAADYLRFQADTLRRHAKNQWVTTNFINRYPPVSPPLSGRDLDIITWSLYPVAGLYPDAEKFRFGDGAAMSWMHDYARTINGAQGVMELQPGQVNWGPVNPQPYPGAVRMWIMRAFAAGSKLVCTYRYRQPLYGNEQYHYGIVGTDGVTPSTGGRQFEQAMREIRTLRALYRPNAKEPARYAARRTAFLYNVENQWNLDNHTQTTRWDTWGHLFKYYRALKGFGAPVDVVTEDKDFAEYPFLVAPAYQLLDEKLVRRWTEYVERGGHLVLTLRTGQKDRRGHLWEASYAAPISELIGAGVESYDVLPDPLKGKARAGAKVYEWAVWGESLKPKAGTTALATYADQFYAANVAAVTRRLGRGTVTYVGVESLTGELERDLLRRVFTTAGVAVENYEDQFLVDWRDGFWVATNFTSKRQLAPAPPNAKILIGTRTVEPAGVTVWME